MIAVRLRLGRTRRTPRTEERFLVLGMSTTHRLPVVAYAERPPRTRLIRAREAARRERHYYEEGQEEGETGPGP